MTEQRHIAITGATGGIGAALTRRFAAVGYKVSAIGRNGALLEELAAGSDNIIGLACDVGDGADCARAFAEASEAFGPIDSLIAAAAVYPKAFFLDQEAEHLSEVLRINVVGVANAVREVLPSMLERNFGRVVVVGSLAGMKPLPGSLAYSVSKWTLHSLVRGIAGEIDRTRYTNVLINEFSPGATKTAMSSYGNDPEVIFDWIRPLVECDKDGPHGRFFQEWREIRIGESWKAAIKRLVLRSER
ncbi:MAG: SDR family oxidoreductase [Erythrobacter sp.]|uniref:SDR family oxidoreductase n=1 Tax=Erythrobacter sp. TaxID=1042 RepID=UPI0025D53A6A|nr:SDR family NAD(P)-dependent oxidoreductase [Erythrobacter sp.]MCL9998907.1 SDR family oxidoreductase [Erythrobacter sp.]